MIPIDLYTIVLKVFLVLILKVQKNYARTVYLYLICFFIYYTTLYTTMKLITVKPQTHVTY